MIQAMLKRRYQFFPGNLRQLRRINTICSSFGWPQGKSVFSDEDGNFDKAAMDKFMNQIYIENIWYFSKDKNKDIFKHTKQGTLEEFFV